jgi:aminopeptidase
MNHLFPSPLILQRYAKVLVDFALNDGKGIKKGDVVRLNVSESAKPLYVALRDQILKSGGIPLTNYMPDDVARGYYELANHDQLTYFPIKMTRGMVEDVDHSISIISDTNLHELEGIDPKKILARNNSFKQLREWWNEKENKGKYTWTLALYPTPAMAREAKMSLKDYWQQIINACFLDQKDPIAKWKNVFSEVSRLQTKLNKLAIEKVHIEGEGIDLWVRLG